MKIGSKKETKSLMSVLLALNILAMPISPVFAMGGSKTVLECALEDCETDENLIFDNTQEPNNEETNIDFLAQEAPAETPSLQGNLSEETLVDANFSQAATFEGESLQKEATDVSEVEALQEETPEKSSTLELPTAAAAGAEGSETAEPESGLTLAEWNYTEENGGIVLTSLKDNNAKNVVVPGEFTDAPGKQVYIKGGNADRTTYPSAVTNLQFKELYDGIRVKFLNNADTAFRYYNNLKNFDGSGLDTSGVTDMRLMFADCPSLTVVHGLRKWDTKKVTNIRDMFNGCTALTTISGLEKWETEYVENLDSMFYGCTALNEINCLKEWSTENVGNMETMFYGCKNLKLVNLANCDLSKGGRYVNMYAVFAGTNQAPLLVISPEEKLKNYNYAGDRRTPVGPKFDANGGKFPESSADGGEDAGISTQADGEVSADGSEIRQGKTTYWLENNNTAVDEFISTAIEQPTRDDGLVFCGWEPQDLPENPNAYDRMTATYKAKWGTLKINATDREIEQGATFDPLDGVTAEDGNGDPIPANQIAVISNDVDVNKSGDYSVTYKATDSFGNTAQKTITVKVKAKPQIIEPDKNKPSSPNETDKTEIDTNEPNTNSTTPEEAPLDLIRTSDKLNDFTLSSLALAATLAPLGLILNSKLRKKKSDG